MRRTNKFFLLNPKFVVVGVVAAFAVIIGIIFTSGPTLFSDTPGGSIFSPSNSTFVILPLEVELDDITVLEATEDYAVLEVKFLLTNPNEKAIIVSMVKYSLYEDDDRVYISEIGKRGSGEGMVVGSEYFTLLHESPTLIRDKITIKNDGKKPDFWEALKNNNPNWKIEGEAFFNLSSITAGGENTVLFELTK